MKANDLQSEIEALRREIAALRDEAKSSAGKAKEVLDAGAATLSDQLRGLVTEIGDLTEETEKGVAAHPLTSVLGALALGFLIGRVLPK